MTKRNLRSLMKEVNRVYSKGYLVLFQVHESCSYDQSHVIGNSAYYLVPCNISSSCYFFNFKVRENAIDSLLKLGCQAMLGIDVFYNTPRWTEPLVNSANIIAIDPETREIVKSY